MGLGSEFGLPYHVWYWDLVTDTEIHVVLFTVCGNGIPFEALTLVSERLNA